MVIKGDLKKDCKQEKTSSKPKEHSFIQGPVKREEIWKKTKRGANKVGGEWGMCGVVEAKRCKD